MRSSYKNNDITYSDLLSTITQLVKPKKILEIGILDGFSLESFIKSSNNTTEIHAFDIFDDFNGNHSDMNTMISRFEHFPNVKIAYGNFYNIHDIVTTYDLIHIDIANTGDIIKYAMDHYFSKLTDNGVIIFEGGSISRDNVEWMIKYDKPKIYPILHEYKKAGYNIKTYGDLPSITVITK
jgi:predicted O-methyltransferase YrrM